MGGKGKQHQRLKNNARPSSSGRCATLLGAASPFSTMASQTTRKDLIHLPVIAGDTGKECIETEVDPQYQILIKKMLKKDPITKVKAMRCFETLVCDADASTIKKILPCWSRHYLNLADDSDHKVREAAQHTHLAIVTTAGRNIAVILKQIVPIWITSMFDSYKLASDLARRSLEVAFPQNKLDNVFNFFREEIFNTLLTKITREAERYFGAKDPVKLECERIIVSNLRGYALYLEKEKNREETKAKQKSLLSNEFYWKLADCGSAPIRSAWFECMLSFLQNSLEELLPYDKKFITITFEHMTDADSNAVTHVWNCILMIQEKFQDWQKYADIKLVVAQKLKTLFENRCFGNSYVISPYYLPFLSKVFDVPVETHLLNTFVENFLSDFKSLVIALQKDGNYEEITANVNAFFECLQYVISKKVADNTNIGEAIQLVDNYINGWIVWSIENDNQVSKQLYKGISNSVRYWLENAKTSEYYDKLLETLWMKLKNVIETVNNAENTTNVVENLLNLFQCLSVSKQSQTDGVNYATLRLKEQLKPLSVKLTKLILKKAVQEYDIHYFGHLRTACKVFNDIEFFEEVSENRNLIYLLKQLDVCLLRGSAPALIVDIIFEVLQHLKSEERLSFVENLLKNSNNFAQQWILQKLLSRPLCMETETHRLLAQTYVRDILIRIANKFVEENTAENLTVLQQCYSQTDCSHDLIIGNEILIEILDILTKPFEKIVNSDLMEKYGNFFVDIMPNLTSAKNNTTLLEKMFIHLSNILIKAYIKNFMSEELFERVLQCWQDVLKETCFTVKENMLSDCAHLVKQEMKSIDVTIQSINNIANLIFDLLDASKKDYNQEQMQNTGIAKLCEIFSSYDSPQTVSQLENYCRYSGCLKGFLVYKPISIVELPNWNSIHQLIVLNSFQLHIICLHLSGKENIPQDSEKCSNESIEVDENISKWEPQILTMVLDVLKTTAMSLEVLDKFPNEIKANVAEIISTTKQKLTTFLSSVERENRNTLIEQVLERVVHDNELWAQTIMFFIDNGVNVDAKIWPILDEFTGNKKVLSSQTSYFVHQTLCFSYPRAIPFEEEYFLKELDLVLRVAKLRININNYFTSDINYISDKAILKTFQHLLSEIVTLQKTSENLLNSNEDISTVSFQKVMLCAEIAKLITECLIHFPLELNVEHWDFIRVTLNTWILLVSRSLKDYKLPQVAIFVLAVYKVHAALYQCFEEFKIKSSTFLLTTVIDEWENLFKVEATLVLFKTFHIILTSADETDNTYTVLYDAICPHMEFLDFGIVIDACEKGYHISLDECINFLLNAFFSKVHSVRFCAFAIFRKIIGYLVKKDTIQLDKGMELEVYKDNNWHLVYRMYPLMVKCANSLGHHLQEFDFKLTNIPELTPIHRETLLGYFLLWDSALLICSAASVELRSFYAQWIASNRIDEVVLPLLFRAMPVEILKNYDSQVIKNDVFKPLEWMQMKDQNLATERYACHLYAQTLRYLPAVVRRWWNESNPRQKAFVDKLTTNYVSNLLCQEELRSIINKRTEHENMQVTVHNSTREVIATYSIDEAKMELVICLARNHPLGSAKIESEKLIGGRLQSRVIVRELTIYLTHQNGSILDVLSLWKKHLDKKFEGVEECYVCYSVIHHDTCQLPKLTCKTCRKKFHGPCLYKWFTTSSKSTCPICRNVF